MKKLLPILLALLLMLIASRPAPALSRLSGSFKAVIAETDASLWGVQVFPEGRIRICGADGTFVRSVDGGKTWEESQVKEGVSLRVMHWIDQSRGIIVGRQGDRNVVFLTRSGGEMFSEKSLSVAYPVHGIAFLDSRRGWLVTGSAKEMEGAWRQTTNGGSTWKKRDSVAFGSPARSLFGISAAGEDRLWAVGGHVEVSLVGDASRSLLYRKKKGSVLFSGDRGESWEVQDAGNPIDVRLKDVEFIDEKTGWVVGDKGFAARTTDGGATWKVLDTGVEEGLSAVDALSDKVAFAVGAKGTAIATSDGGKSFSILHTGTKKDLRDVSFVDENTGYAVGKTGTVLRFHRAW